MHINSTIRTSSGIRLVAESPMTTVSLTEREASLLASALRREAESALAEGSIEAFDRLHTRATAIQEGARVTSRRSRDFRCQRRVVGNVG